MATKKNSSELQLEIKTAKSVQKPAKTSIPVKESPQNQNISSKYATCSSSTLDKSKNDNSSLKPSSGSLNHSFSANSECCSGTRTAPIATTQQFAQKHSTQAYPNQYAELKKATRTHVVVHYDVGFNHSIFIRGKGADLRWDKGIQLKNTKNDEWIWETEAQFNSCEFKVLIDDNQYESGENHPISCGACIHYTPKF